MITIQKLQANTKAFSKAEAVKAKVYRRPNNFQVAGEGDIYEVSTNGNFINCTCKAAEFGRACYHAASVFTLIEAEASNERSSDAWMDDAQAEQDEARFLDERQAAQDEAEQERRDIAQAEAKYWDELEGVCECCDQQETDGEVLTVADENEYCDALVTAHDQWEPGYERPTSVNYIN